jgi:HlyD family secretion protein
MKTVARRRLIVWGLVGLVVVAMIVIAMWPQPVMVDMATVERGPMRVTLDHEGQTRVRDRFVVSAPVGGRVLRIQLEPGDRVEANQTALATFLPSAPAPLDARTRAQASARARAAAAALETARAQRERADAQHQFAVTERDRMRRLADEGAVSEQTRESAEAEARVQSRMLQAADASVQAALHDLEAANAALLDADGDATAGRGTQITLRSPIDGVVLRRLRESEAVVPPGEPLMEVADPDRLEVVADYLSADAVRMTPGMPVVIDRWGGGTELTGRVRRVEPAAFLKISALGVEEQRVWVVIDFEDARSAWQALGDGYRVETRVVVWERPDVVIAPTSALFRHAGGWAVFVVENGRAAQRPVEIGQRNGVSAEVTKGLEPGEKVVIHPPDAVSDGVRVSSRAGGEA